MWVDEVLGPIRSIEVIAAGGAVRSREQLRREFGGSRWRKLKGEALVRDYTGKIYEAEIHWYEAHGVGKVNVRVKRPL